MPAPLLAAPFVVFCPPLHTYRLYILLSFLISVRRHDRILLYWHHFQGHNVVFIEMLYNVQYINAYNNNSRWTPRVSGHCVLLIRAYNTQCLWSMAFSQELVIFCNNPGRRHSVYLFIISVSHAACSQCLWCPPAVQCPQFVRKEAWET